jgi:hypothetical protein
MKMTDRFIYRLTLADGRTLKFESQPDWVRAAGKSIAGDVKIESLRKLGPAPYRAPAWADEVPEHMVGLDEIL